MGAGAALARCYDLDMAEEADDLDLYLALAARGGGPILELAVGSGRIAVPLAVAGNPVVGVDHDADMLARAEHAWARARGRRPQDRLRLVEGDLVSVRLEERFDLVILALNSLMLLPDRAAQAAALRTMAAHLGPGSRAVVDVAIPDLDDLALYDGRLMLEWLREDPETGSLVSKSVSARFDAATASVDLVQLFDAVPARGGPAERTVRRDRLLLLGVDLLLGMARDAGLEVEELGGDYQLTPFGPGSGRAVLVSRLV